MVPPPPTAGPAPSRKGKARARELPTPPQPRLRISNTSYHCAIRDLKRVSVTLRSTPKLYPNSDEAGEFRNWRYDLSSFMPGHLHPDNVLSPSYAQAASGSGSGGKGKNKAGKPSSPQQVASSVAPPVQKGPPSLPGAKRRFFAPARPSPLTQTPLLELQPSLTSLLASCETLIASCP